MIISLYNYSLAPWLVPLFSSLVKLRCFDYPDSGIMSMNPVGILGDHVATALRDVIILRTHYSNSLLLLVNSSLTDNNLA